MKHSNQHAFLFVGTKSDTKKEAMKKIKRRFCTECDNTCKSCKAIEEKKYHGITWITPSKRYTLDDIAIIFEKTALVADYPHFFIIDQADTLSLSCANKLLKVIEEPPTGYYFIFLAQRTQMILPTIKSRCTLYVCKQTTEKESLPAFLRHFDSFSNNPIEFYRELSKIIITEQESIEYIEQLLSYWLNHYKNQNLSPAQNNRIQSIIIFLNRILKQPPMPGGVKIFWKNVFIGMHATTTTKANS